MSKSDSQRLQMLLEYLKLNPSAFAKSLGLQSKQTIYNILKERNGLSSKMVTLICTYYKQINSIWLLSGNGSMLSETPDYFPDANGRVKYILAVFKQDIAELAGKLDIPPYKLNQIVMEGKKPTMKILQKLSEVFPHVRKKWIYENDGPMMDKPGCLAQGPGEGPTTLPFVISAKLPDSTEIEQTYTMKGDSMLPVYRPGDILLYRVVNKSSMIEWGRNYFIQTTSHILIRRILSASESEITIHAVNTDYPDMTINKNDINILAIIVGFFRHEQ
jgi:plasmid maintenance system antidote protein VapI